MRNTSFRGIIAAMGMFVLLSWRAALADGADGAVPLPLARAVLFTSGV